MKIMYVKKHEYHMKIQPEFQVKIWKVNRCEIHTDFEHENDPSFTYFSYRKKMKI